MIKKCEKMKKNEKKIKNEKFCANFEKFLQKIDKNYTK